MKNTPVKKMSRVILLILIFTTVFITPQSVLAADATVNVNFGQAVDYPLLKTKIAPFNCAYVGYDRWMRDIYMINELKTDSLRYETGWGMGDSISTLNNNYAARHELGAPQISGSANNLIYNFTQMDDIIDASLQRSIYPMNIHGYNPVILQNSGTDYVSMPNDLDAWKQINKDFAQHWKDTGRKIGYYEVWNEPDLYLFFSGTRDDYFQIYNYGARGIKEGDPDALVGGPSLAYADSWVTPFLDYVRDNNLPLDFLSFHKFTNPQDVVPLYRSLLNGRPECNTTEMILSEYASYFPGANPDFLQDGPIDTYIGASMMLHDFRYFLQQPDLTKVYWAQFNDPEVFGDSADRCGIINNDGRRKATFNAYKVFADMPVDRKLFTSNNSSIEGMASSDGHKSGVALWNMSSTSKTIDLNLSNIPFATGNLKVYRIDSAHASFNNNPDSENLEVVESRTGISTSNLTWSGTIPGQSVVYITVDDGTFISQDVYNPVAKVIKTNHYYFERNKSHYSEFDPNTWTAYLGMANEEYADALVGVTAEELPQNLNVSFSIDGTPQYKDNNSLLGIRIDYMVNGTYTKGVLFHGGLYNSGRDSKLPWGTKELPDQVVQVANLSDFSINLNTYAPSGWNSGRAIISFQMQNAGAGTRAKVKINKVTGQSRNHVQWYKLDETSGTTAADSAGNGLAGTLNGSGVWSVEGIINRALTFNGTNSYLTIPRKVADDFSIGFWVKTTQTGGTGPWYQGRGLIDGEIAGVTNDFGVSLVGSKLGFGVGNPDTTILSATDINDGKWHYCTATRSKSTGQIRLYVDGKLEASGNGGTQSLNAATNLNVGRIQTGFNYFDGMMDDIRIYNYVLDQGEINELTGKKFQRGMYHFDESSGSTAVDASGNQNNVALSGASWVAGKTGNGVQFNGTSSFGTLGRKIADDFTIGFWIKTTQTGGTGPWYQGAGLVDGECAGVTNDFGVSLLGSKLGFGVGRPDTTISSTTDINDGNWHYCTVTRKRATGEIKVYVDGNNEATGVGGKKSLYTPLELNIGRIHTGYNYFNGIIDELRIYNRALSQQEIKALCNMQLD